MEPTASRLAKHKSFAEQTQILTMQCHLLADHQGQIIKGTAHTDGHKVNRTMGQKQRQIKFIKSKQLWAWDNQLAQKRIIQTKANII